MEKSKSKFALRLREAMVSAGYEARPAVLEREFNQRYLGEPVTLHGVRRWLEGETIPREDKLLVLAQWLGVQPQHLRYGVDVEQKIHTRQTRWEEAINHHEREIFEAFLNLPAPQKKIVREVIRAFSKAYPILEDAE
jgi:hypothetical protein